MTLQDVINQVLASGKIDHKIVCPFHVAKQPDGSLGPEKTGSCGVNLENHFFHCFGCGIRGSFVKMKMLLEGVDFDAAKWDLYKGEVPDPLIASFMNEEEEVELIYPESMLALLSPAGAIAERGIEEEESNFYGLLKDKEGNLYLPIRDEEKNLRGCQVRTGSESRYDHFLRFAGGRYFFGEHLFQRSQQQLIVCEGAFDAAKLYGALGVPTLALMGSHFSKKQKAKLGSYLIEEIIIWNDNDIAGREAVKKNYRSLKNLVAGSITSPKYDSADPKDACLTSKERLRELFYERVWIPAL